MTDTDFANQLRKTLLFYQREYGLPDTVEFWRQVEELIGQEEERFEKTKSSRVLRQQMILECIPKVMKTISIEIRGPTPAVCSTSEYIEDPLWKPPENWELVKSTTTPNLLISVFCDTAGSFHYREQKLLKDKGADRTMPPFGVGPCGQDVAVFDRAHKPQYECDENGQLYLKSTGEKLSTPRGYRIAAWGPTYSVFTDDTGGRVTVPNRKTPEKPKPQAEETSWGSEVSEFLKQQASVDMETGEISSFSNWNDVTDQFVIKEVDMANKTVTVGQANEEVEPLSLPPMSQRVFDEYQSLLGMKVKKPPFSTRHPRLISALQWAATLGICGALLYAMKLL